MVLFEILQHVVQMNSKRLQSRNIEKNINLPPPDRLVILESGGTYNWDNSTKTPGPDALTIFVVVRLHFNFQKLVDYTAEHNLIRRDLAVTDHSDS